eukprot:10536692-Karenia_brevis.AAC.1
MCIRDSARGVLVGWALKKDEEKRVMTCDAPEMVLHNMPEKLFIAMDSTSKELPIWNGKRIYTLTIQAKQWALDMDNN